MFPCRLTTEMKRTEGAILLCVANVLVSVRKKRQLCVHSCNSSVDAATVCLTASVYACAHPCVKPRVGGVERERWRHR